MAMGDSASPLRNRLWSAILLAALALAAAVGIRLWMQGPLLPAFAVVRGDLVQTVVASGRVMNPLRVDIGSQITGTVSGIPVDEGQAVKTGQILITLEADEINKQVEQAKFAVAQATARTRQIRETGLPATEQALRQAEATLINARKQFERIQGLRTKGFVGPAQVDDAQKNLDLAESQVRSARLQVADNRPTGGASGVAEMALREAEARLEAAQATLEHSTILAPTDGTLIARNVERGDVVQPGRSLMVLSPSGETQLVVQIDEKNLSLLAPAQKALASAEAYPARTFPAEVFYINPAVDPQRGSIEVKLRVPSPPDYLRQDMTVSVDIEVGRRAGTLVLPLEAVHDSTTSRPWVMQVSAGHAVRREVQLGIRGSNRVEILGGLAAGDVALSAAAVDIADGRRVRTALQAW